jgi:S-(hydroxymethyl)glutathione dehydrogenase / alcohol dehydrogenase
MKAAVLRKAGEPLTIEEVDLDTPRADEVRVRVKSSGLCHSDLHFITGDFPGPMPMVLGHEAAGVVEAVGADVRGFKTGDRVVTCVSAFCGECGECQSGNSQRCDDKPGRKRDDMVQAISSNSQPIYRIGNLGGFAEAMVVNHRSVAKLPEEMPFDSACLMGCGVLTGAGAVLNGAKVEQGSSVAVIGCGGVGLNVIQAARIAGATQIIAIDLSPGKLELAKAFGATHTVTGGADSVAEILELSGGGVDYAFEVIGLTSTIRDAFLMLRKGGTVVLIGIPKMGSEVSLPVLPFIMKEVRVIGSLMGSVPFQIFLPQLARHYLNGVLKLDELVSNRIALEDINDGFAKMSSGDIARSVLVFD